MKCKVTLIVTASGNDANECLRLIKLEMLVFFPSADRGPDCTPQDLQRLQ